MMEYTVTLNSNEDYRILRKILKAFDGASIRPVEKKGYTIEDSLNEVEKGDVVGPFSTVDDFMAELMS